MKKLIKGKIDSFKIEDKLLLEDVSLALDKHEFIVILGRNGAGKSTLLRHLSGEIKNPKSKVIIKEKAIEHYSVSELAQARAVLTQDVQIGFDLSVWELVELGRFSSKEGVRESLIETCLKLTGLYEKREQSYSSLSGGEKQRAQIARTLVQIYDVDDAIYLLDEPTNGLDMAYQYEVLKLIKELATHRFGAIAILHDLNLAAQFADKIILLDEGRVIACGTPKEVLTTHHIEKAFKHSVLITDHPTMNFPLIVSNFKN